MAPAPTRAQSFRSRWAAHWPTPPGRPLVRRPVAIPTGSAPGCRPARHQATGRDLNLVVGQKHNTTVGGDMQERIQGLRKSVAGVSQQLKAPKTWVGSEGVNVLQVLCDTLDLLQEMNTQLAAHTHLPGPTPSPTDATAFTAKAAQALALATKMKPITL